MRERRGQNEETHDLAAAGGDPSPSHRPKMTHLVPLHHCQRLLQLKPTIETIAFPICNCPYIIIASQFGTYSSIWNNKFNMDEHIGQNCVNQISDIPNPI